MLKYKPKILLVFVSCCLLGIITLYLGFNAFEGIRVARYLTKDADKKEKLLLYETDHNALASELRKFANEKRWHRPEINVEPEIFWPRDIALPASIRSRQPTSVAMFDDRIMFEQGGPMLHFGIVVFRDEVVGKGLKELAPECGFTLITIGFRIGRSPRST